jgi:hypothetical protein
MQVRIEKVVVEKHELKVEPEGYMTIGNQIDAMIHEAASKGDELRSIGLLISEAEWAAIAGEPDQPQMSAQEQEEADHRNPLHDLDSSIVRRRKIER